MMLIDRDVAWRPPRSFGFKRRVENGQQLARHGEQCNLRSLARRRGQNGLSTGLQRTTAKVARQGTRRRRGRPASILR